MKYFVAARPGPMPPSPEQFDAAIEWLDGKLQDGTFDCIFGFMEGGGFSIVNAGSHREVLDLMAEYPLLGWSPGRCIPCSSSRRGSTRCARSSSRPRPRWPAAAEPNAAVSGCPPTARAPAASTSRSPPAPGSGSLKLPSRRRGRTVSHAQWEPMAADYQRPGWFTKYVFNPIVAGLTRMGVSLEGSRVLEVRGRTSGEWRRTPVNPLDFDGQRYIVAPRGETQWVRNLRASGEGRLRRGSRVEEFTATELADEDKVPLLRAYLKKWKWEVGAFFQGVGADAPDEDLRRIAPLHPVFRISRR